MSDVSGMKLHQATTRWSVRTHAIEFLGRVEGKNRYADVTLCGREPNKVVARKFDAEGTPIQGDGDATGNRGRGSEGMCGRCVASVNKAARVKEAEGQEG